MSTGFIGNNVVKALDASRRDFAHYHFAFVKPLHTDLLHDVFSRHEQIITVEDGVVKGGFGSAVAEFSAEHDYKIKIRMLGIPDEFIEHGSVNELQRLSGIDIKTLEKIFSEY